MFSSRIPERTLESKEVINQKHLNASITKKHSSSLNTLFI